LLAEGHSKIPLLTARQRDFLYFPAHPKGMVLFPSPKNMQWKTPHPYSERGVSIK
jgi:hypothetical protein